MLRDKKILGLFVLVVLGLSLVSPLVAADFKDDVKTIGQGFVDFFDGILRPTIGYLLGQSSAPGELFLKTLVFILAILFFFGALDSVNLFEGAAYQKWIEGGIALIFALIGVRFMPEGILQTFTAPSSALIALLVVGLPTVFLFFFMQKLPSGLRKGGWVLYSIILAGIILKNWYSSSAGWQTWNWVYVAFALAGLSMIKFNERFVLMAKASVTNKNVKQVIDNEITTAESELARLQKQRSNTPQNKLANLDEQIADQEKLLKDLRKQLAAYS